MKDYGLSYRGVIFSSMGALLLLFWLSAFGATPVSTRCPKPNSLHYDQGQARFIAQGTAGLGWRSEELAVLSPVPALTAQPPVAFGKAKQVRIMCPYRYADYNNVMLLPKDASQRFELSNLKSWRGHDVSASASGYFRCKALDCRFTLLKNKDTEKR